MTAFHYCSNDLAITLFIIKEINMIYFTIQQQQKQSQQTGLGMLLL
jgi:hypothetical protein